MQSEILKVIKTIFKLTIKVQILKYGNEPTVKFYFVLHMSDIISWLVEFYQNDNTYIVI